MSDDSLDNDDIDVSAGEVSAKVTYRNAILLQCHECMGYYSEGKQDCRNVRCSLYSFMPYRELEPDLKVFKRNPKRCGLVMLQPPDPEKSAAAKERFAK
jgi:hypothetical protein